MVTDPPPLALAHVDTAAGGTELPRLAAFALEQMQRICSSMFDMRLASMGPPCTFDPKSLTYGACISLIGDSGSWEMALFGDELGCSSLARAFFAMDPSQQPTPDEIVDAMGELLNMVSGAVKTRLDRQEHERMAIGIPMFYTSRSDCESYRTRVIPLVQQQLQSNQLQGALHLVWSERTPIVLLEEARACLAGKNDKLALSHGLAALHELSEILAESTPPENAAALVLCRKILTDVINERSHESLHVVQRIIDALIEALSEDFLVPLRMPRQHAATTSLPTLQIPAAVPVQRDAETLDMLQEFLSESQEGLEKCDELLLQVEAGRGDADSVAALFRQFHTIKGVASFHALTDVEHLAHTTETLLANVRDGKASLAGTTLDLVFESTAVLGRSMVTIREAVNASLSFPPTTAARDLCHRIEALMRGEAVDTGPRALEAPRTPQWDGANHGQLTETVKIEVDQLNQLDTLLQQLRTELQSLDSTADFAHDINACTRAKEIVAATEMLAVRMRMVPLRTLFQKLTRMARDLARKTEKLATLELSGEDTRVDRNVAEKLNGPLVHMIRNAIDHGLESAEQRRCAGKPLIGTIYLRARREGGNAVLEIADDGRGLDAEAILKKARATGLLSQEQTLDEGGLFQLILEPGFSTAAQVTAISGRGVGMDVVRREIEALHGRIEIESRLGAGTCFRITLPQHA